MYPNDHNLEAVYSALYNRCPGCCLTRRDTAGTDLGKIIEAYPPVPEELAGWVTDPDDEECKYCQRIAAICLHYRMIGHARNKR